MTCKQTKAQHRAWVFKRCYDFFDERVSCGIFSITLDGGTLKILNENKVLKSYRRSLKRRNQETVDCQRIWQIKSRLNYGRY